MLHFNIKKFVFNQYKRIFEHRIKVRVKDLQNYILKYSVYLFRATPLKLIFAFLCESEAERLARWTKTSVYSREGHCH